MKRFPILSLLFLSLVYLSTSCSNPASQTDSVDISTPKATITVDSTSVLKSIIHVTVQDILKVRVIFNTGGLDVITHDFIQSQWGIPLVIDLPSFGDYTLSVIEYTANDVILEQKTAQVNIAAGKMTTISITPGGAIVGVESVRTLKIYDFTILTTFPSDFKIVNDTNYQVDSVFTSDGVQLKSSSLDNVPFLTYPISPTTNWKYTAIAKGNFLPNTKSAFQLTACSSFDPLVYLPFMSADSPGSYWNTQSTGFFVWGTPLTPIGTNIPRIFHQDDTFYTFELSYDKTTNAYSAKVVSADGTVFNAGTVPAVLADQVLLGGNCWSQVNSGTFSTIKSIQFETW